MEKEKPASRIFFDAFKITISLTAALGFFMLLLLAGSNYMRHSRQVSLFQSSKTPIKAQITDILLYKGGRRITVQWEDGAEKPESRIDPDFFSTSYLDALQEGQEIDVYVNPGADQVVPVAQFEYFMNDITYIKTEIIIMLICIIILAVDPRVLLLGTKGWSIITMLNQEKRK